MPVAQWTPAQRHAAVDQVERGMTAVEVARLMGVRPATIRQWAKRRRDALAAGAQSKLWQRAVGGEEVSDDDLDQEAAALALAEIPQLEGAPDSDMSPSELARHVFSQWLEARQLLQEVARGTFDGVPIPILNARLKASVSLAPAMNVSDMLDLLRQTDDEGLDLQSLAVKLREIARESLETE